MTASWLPAPLIPPFRFGTVEPEVYRGAYPKQRNLRYLKRLKLKTILSLIPDKPDEVFQEFCREQGITPIHLPVDKVKDNVPLTYNRAVEAVQIMIDPDNLPIYVHCLDGASVTGLVVCCLRKLQTWNISSAMGEFLRYLRGGVISSEESVFVEKFASEIEISKPIPLWLWEGQVTFKKHPTLKLNFTMPSGTNPSLQNQQQQLQQISTPVSSSSVNIINASIGTNIGAGGGVGSPKLFHHHNPHQQNTLATPTIAALARIKRANAGIQSPFSQQLPPPLPQQQQQQQQQQSQTQQSAYSSSVSTPLSSSTTFLQNAKSVEGSTSSSLASISKTATGGQLPSGLGVRLDNTMIPNLSGLVTSSTTAQSQPTSAIISVVPQGDSNHTSGSQAVEGETTNGIGLSKDGGSRYEQQAQSQSQAQPQQQHQQQTASQSTAKNSPAISNNSTSASGNASNANTEPVDEYYEVSMTLKALALEGADF